MKISYRTHPVLEMIKNRNATIAFVEEDEMKSKELLDNWKWLRNKFKNSCPFFESNVIMMTEPFVDAYEKAYTKLNTKELLMKTESSSGTIIIKHTTFCYNILNVNGEFFYEIFVFVNHKTATRNTPFLSGISYRVPRHYEDSQEKIIIQKDDIKKYYYSHKFMNANSKDEILSWVLLLLNFIKYAQIETKVVGANKRVKEINCKYVNDTDSDITILDSTWFTTLVKSEGFKVRGHFRLQPYGPGMQEKKLIWIKDFEKSGYTREAKRPLNDDELPTA